MFILIIVLFFLIYQNKRTINILKDTDLKHKNSFENIIDAVNYNDKLLFENQKYVHQVYEENNSFSSIKRNTVVPIKTNTEKQYYDMMKNYDALTHLSK
tara:strand:- start:3270 stop:3566 length:297 start_codon:yes stop_codon:yes gene_type:complete